MSQENVEIVRRVWDVIVDGLDRGNPAAAFDAIFDDGLLSPGSTFTPASEVPGTETYVGRDGFDEFLRAWTEEFDDFRIWPEQIVDAGDDRVAAVLRQTATGKASGAAVELRFGAVYTLQDGQIIDRRHYLDVAEALRAVAPQE